MSLKHRQNLDQWLRHQKNLNWRIARLKKLRACLWELDGYCPPLKKKK